MLRFSLSDVLSSSEIPHPKGFTTVSQHHQMETKDTSALHTPTIAFVDYWEAYYYTQSVLQRLSWEYKVLEGNDCTFLLIDCVSLVSVAATTLCAKAIWKSLFQLTVGSQGRNLRVRGSHWWHHPQWAEPAHINHQSKRLARLQVNVVEVFSQLRFLYPNNSRLCQVDQN